MSERRDWIRAVAAALLAAPLAAASQVAGRIYRLGILRRTLPGVEDVPTALREQGCSEGQNLIVERRYANGRVEPLPALARELLRADEVIP